MARGSPRRRGECATPRARWTASTVTQQPVQGSPSPYSRHEVLAVVAVQVQLLGELVPVVDLQAARTKQQRRATHLPSSEGSLTQHHSPRTALRRLSSQRNRGPAPCCRAFPMLVPCRAVIPLPSPEAPPGARAPKGPAPSTMSPPLPQLQSTPGWPTRHPGARTLTMTPRCKSRPPFPLSPTATSAGPFSRRAHLDHDVALEVVLEALELQLQDRREALEQHALLGVLQPVPLGHVLVGAVHHLHTRRRVRHQPHKRESLSRAWRKGLGPALLPPDGQAGAFPREQAKAGVCGGRHPVGSRHAVGCGRRTSSAV